MIVENSLLGSSKSNGTEHPIRPRIAEHAGVQVSQDGRTVYKRFGCKSA